MESHLLYLREIKQLDSALHWLSMLQLHFIRMPIQRVQEQLTTHQHAGFSNCTIPDDYTFDRLHANKRRCSSNKSKSNPKQKFEQNCDHSVN